MKTSFYFVLWILIYPILGLFDNSLINNNAFIVALAVVWGLSWFLNRIMPETLSYERASQIAPILEDVYTGDVTSFKKRLSREVNIEVMTSIYFIVTTVVIALAVIKDGVNDCIALAIFGFFTIGAISRSAGLIKAKSQLNDNPTGEQCMEIADETYKLDMPHIMKRVAMFLMRRCCPRSQNISRLSKYFQSQSQLLHHYLDYSA